MCVCLALRAEDRVRHRRRHARPALVFSDAALMQLVGFNAQPVRHGGANGGPRNSGERTPGPISPETLANNIVQLHLRDLEERVQWGDSRLGEGWRL